MMKKKYVSPKMDVYEIRMSQPLLIGSELFDKSYDPWADEITDETMFI